MGLLGNNDRYVEVKEALEEVGIEVVSGEFHGKDQIKVRVKRGNVMACAFVPAKDKHDVGNSTAAAVSSVRKALVMRGARFDEAPVTTEHVPPVNVPGFPTHRYPNRGQTDMAPKKRKEDKKHVYLSKQEKADAYSMVSNKVATFEEVRAVYGVSRNTMFRIIQDGDNGHYKDLLPKPAEVTPEPSKVVINNDIPNPEITFKPRTKTDLLNPKVLSIAQRANGLLDLLAELKKDGAVVGVDVEYKLKVEL